MEYLIDCILNEKRGQSDLARFLQPRPFDLDTIRIQKYWAQEEMRGRWKREDNNVNYLHLMFTLHSTVIAASCPSLR